MNNQNEQTLSAQVVLKPKDGRDLPSAADITAENIERFLPAAEDFRKAQKNFTDAGFEVDGGFANSFSITGKRKLFEIFFNTKIFTNERQAVKTRSGDRPESSELPLANLSAALKEIVATVTFTEPPDFGPENF
jgi:hypothetical protein